MTESAEAPAPVGDTRLIYRLSKHHASIALFCAAAALGLTVWINSSVFGRRFLEKHYPVWSDESLFRTAACAAVGVLLAFAISKRREEPQAKGAYIGGNPAFAAAYLTSLALLAFTAIAILAAPKSLIHYVDELGSIALLQEFAIAAAVLLCVAAAQKSRHLDLPRVAGVPGPVIIGMMGFALFLLLMEETSYGQHYFGWEAPGTFSGNLQNETNLHNFYTYRFELVYYWAAILAFVAAPFAWPGDPPAFLKSAFLKSAFLKNIGFYIAPRSFALIALPVCAFLYEAWNIVPLQIGFFLALTIGLIMAWRMRGSKPNAMLALVMVAVMAVSQALFIANGDQLSVDNEIEEMREMQICWLVLAYTLWLFAKVKRSAHAPDAAFGKPDA